jgi:hypothetical protein
MWGKGHAIWSWPDDVDDVRELSVLAVHLYGMSPRRAGSQRRVVRDFYDWPVDSGNEADDYRSICTGNDSSCYCMDTNRLPPRGNVGSEDEERIATMKVSIRSNCTFLSLLSSQS